MSSKFVFSSTGSYLDVQGVQRYFLTGLTFNESFDKVEVTDTSTSGDGKEYITGRAERGFSAEVMMNVSASDVPLNTQYIMTASFEGRRYFGSASLYTKNVQGSIDDSIKVSYEGSFNGAVTYKSASQV